MLNDLRYALRILLKHPGFSAVVVLTLAIAIGANTAIFTVVDRIVLRPLPFANSDRLLAVWQGFPKRGWGMQVNFSFPNYVDLKNQTRTLENVGAAMFGGFNLNAGDSAERLQGAWISSSIYPTFGALPMAGRNFLPEEEKPRGARVVMIRESLWQRRFNSDTAILGKPITIDGQPCTVVGVVPSDGPFPGIEVFVPLNFDYGQAGRGNRLLKVFALLKKGGTLDQTTTELASIAQRLVPADVVCNTDLEITAVPLQEQVVGGIRPALMLMLGAVGFVLLIACTNVAGLMLARADGRHREMAIRAAVGASRGRLVRQMLTESVLLAAIGGGLGTLLAVWGVRGFAAIAPPFIPRLRELACDTPVLIFSAAITLLSGIAFGLVPAVHRSSAAGLTDGLKEGSKGSGGKSRQSLRGALVMVQVGLAMILLTGAGLMIRTLQHRTAVQPGFDPENVLAMHLTLPGSNYANPERKAVFVRDLIRRACAIPGIRAAEVVSALPFSGESASGGLAVEGRNYTPTDYPHAEWRSVSPAYLSTLGVPLLQGRMLQDSDNLRTPRVALINQAMARYLWPNEDPMGKHIRPDMLGLPAGQWVTIVGQVGNVRHFSVAGDPVPEMYLPYAQAPVEFITLIARTTVPPMALAEPIKREIAKLDPTLPIFNVNTLDRLVDGSSNWPRFILFLLGLFAGIALVLATLGIYGVIAYSVRQRTREIGIRMALGAQRRDVMRLISKQGAILIVAGIAIGVAGALGLTRFMSNLLFGVRPTDAATFVGVAALLGAIAMAACLIPARRATRIEPMLALRGD